MPSTAPVGARSKAEALATALRNAGVTDLYVPKRIHGRSRISLGLYKVKRVAEKRIAELKEKGFEAFMVPWRKLSTQYMLAVHGIVTEKSNDLLSTLPSPSPNTTPEGNACALLAGG